MLGRLQPVSCSYALQTHSKDLPVRGGTVLSCAADTDDSQQISHRQDLLQQQPWQCSEAFRLDCRLNAGLDMTELQQHQLALLLLDSRQAL